MLRVRLVHSFRLLLLRSAREGVDVESDAEEGVEEEVEVEVVEGGLAWGGSEGVSGLSGCVSGGRGLRRSKNRWNMTWLVVVGGGVGIGEE